MTKAEALWRRTFDFLRGRKRDYQITFGSPAGARVLIDLARFCRANETTFSPDARMHAVYEGRREVWLRIQQHLHLSSEQLIQLYNGLSPILPAETETESED